MMELLVNAWLGWERYIQEGKLAALLLAALLFCWFCKKGMEQKPFLVYGTVMTVCCICPVTAVLLMTYQTRFYDYQWIWSAVPITALTAYGIILLQTDLWSCQGREKRRLALTVSVLLALVLVLCGKLGKTGAEIQADESEERRREHAVWTLELAKDVAAQEGGEEIVLWAPAEILEYAREADSEIKLLYGRNMWNAALNAYSYDVYSQEQIAMYRRMESWAGAEAAAVMNGQGTGISEDGVPADESMDNWRAADYARAAKQEGVNCIILPDSLAWATVRSVSRVMEATPKLVEDYWIIYGKLD